MVTFNWSWWCHIWHLRLCCLTNRKYHALDMRLRGDEYVYVLVTKWKRDEIIINILLACVRVINSLAHTAAACVPPLGALASSGLRCGDRVMRHSDMGCRVCAGARRGMRRWTHNSSANAVGKCVRSVLISCISSVFIYSLLFTYK